MELPADRLREGCHRLPLRAKAEAAVSHPAWRPMILNDGDRFLLIDRGVQRNFTDGCSDIAGSTAVSRRVIGQNEIVVDRLGNADKADRTFDLRRIAGKLADGVHRVVAADVKEIADVQPFQFFKEDAVEAVGEVLREFKTAGTQIRRRSQAKKFQIVIGECF